MNRILILALLLLPVTAGAATFKCVDEDGKTQYSDKPCPGAEEVELPPLSTFDAPTPQKLGRANNAEEETADPEGADYELAITSPEHESAFWSNDGAFGVTVSIEPQLRSGHQLVLLVDGAPTANSPLSGTSTTVEGLNRGSHSLRAVVQDEAGSQLAVSPVVQIHIHQRSIRQ